MVGMTFRVEPYLDMRYGTTRWKATCEFDFPVVTENFTTHRVIAYAASAIEAIIKITASGVYNLYVTEFYDHTKLGASKPGQLHYLVERLDENIDASKRGANTLYLL